MRHQPALQRPVVAAAKRQIIAKIARPGDEVLPLDGGRPGGEDRLALFRHGPGQLIDIGTKSEASVAIHHRLSPKAQGIEASAYRSATKGA